jgi:hypothetical protein
MWPWQHITVGARQNHDLLVVSRPRNGDAILYVDHVDGQVVGVQRALETQPESQKQSHLRNVMLTQ